MLVIFGAAAIYMGVDGRATVRDSLKQEQIVFGAADDPAIAKHASQWADEQVTNGTQARAFAQVIHEHALEGSDGLTYAQMGRFVSAADSESAAGTSDEAAALKDDKGQPVSNSARNTWVTATALSTALNVSYPLTAKPGETTRFYVVAAGPTLDTNFHVVGGLLDRAWVNGDMTNPPQKGVQTVLVPAGGGAVFDVKLDKAGLYPFVSHAFAHVDLGQVGLLKVGAVKGTMSH